MKSIKKIVFVVFLLLSPFISNALAVDQVFFYHTDPAGTPMAISDANGQVVWRGDYKPFGEEDSVSGTLANDRKFVGKEKDEETGLYYFGARYMDAKVGRFAAVDPVRAVDTRTGKVLDKLLKDPQKLNCYAYGLNNPHKYLDPNGDIVILQGDLILLQHYERLKNTSLTARLAMKILEDSKTTFTIKIGKENSYGYGVITYNPYKTSLYQSSTKYEDWHDRPPEIGLGHEIIHGVHDEEHPLQYLFRSRSEEEPMTIGIGKYSKEIITENGIRSDYSAKGYNVKERPQY